MTHSPAVTEGALLHFNPHLLSREDRYLAESRGIDREKELHRAKPRRVSNVEEYMIVIHMLVQWKSNKLQDRREEMERNFVAHVGCAWRMALLAVAADRKYRGFKRS